MSNKAIETYVEEALKRFGNGYNCAQAVATVFCDKANLSEDEAKACTAGLEGGKKDFCGAFLGTIMIAEKAGLDPAAFTESINDAFTQAAGSTYCKQIKANKVSCKSCVALGAKVLAEVFDELE